MTMTLVSTVTVGATAVTAIEFTSIPQTGTDLLLVVSGRVNNTTAVNLSFNGSATSFTSRVLQGTGSSVSSASGTNQFMATDSTGNTANTFGNSLFYVPNYAGSTNKSFSVDSVNEENGTGADQAIYAGLWANTAAITSITLTRAFSGTGWQQYSTASLYTITKGSGGATVS